MTTVGYWLAPKHEDAQCVECGGTDGNDFTRYVPHEERNWRIYDTDARRAFDAKEPLRCIKCGGTMVWQDVDFTVHGDYTGGTVERSNYEVFREQARELEKPYEDCEPGPDHRLMIPCPDCDLEDPDCSTCGGSGRVEGPARENVDWRTQTWDFGTRGVQAQVRPDGTIHPWVQEWEDGLSAYPLADDEHHSSLECELEEEAWGDYVCSDFWKAIRKRMENTFAEGGDEDHSVQLAELDDADPEREAAGQRVLRAWFHKLAEAANEYVEIETGCNVYWRIDKIVAQLKGYDAYEMLEELRQAMGMLS